MNREDMRDWIGSQDRNNRYPSFIISYKRAGEAPTLNLMKSWKRTDDIHVVVRDSQKEEYQRAYPMFRVVSLPDERVNSCGAARWGAVDLALAFGEDVALMFDDDIIEMKYLFERTIQSGKNAGAPCSGSCTNEDIYALGLKDKAELSELVSTGMSTLAREVFAKEKNAVLGGPSKRHISFNINNATTKYCMNGMVTPRQMMAWHVARMEESGIRLDIPKFGITGEDLGVMAELLSKGRDAFALPSLIYDHWNEGVNIRKSVIRNADTEAILNEAEWNNLQTYPIKDYLRVKNDKDGYYQWGDVDWRALGKIRGYGLRRIPW